MLKLSYSFNNYTVEKCRKHSKHFFCFKFAVNENKIIPRTWSLVKRKAKGVSSNFNYLEGVYASFFSKKSLNMRCTFAILIQYKPKRVGFLSIINFAKLVKLSL